MGESRTDERDLRDLVADNRPYWARCEYRPLYEREISPDVHDPARLDNISGPATGHPSRYFKETAIQARAPLGW